MIVDALALQARPHHQMVCVAQLDIVLRIVGEKIIFDAVTDRGLHRNGDEKDRTNRRREIRIQMHLVAQEGQRVCPRPGPHLVLCAEYDLCPIKPLCHCTFWFHMHG